MSCFPPPLSRGPVKLLLADHSLPSLDDAHRLDRGRARGRPTGGRPLRDPCVARADAGGAGQRRDRSRRPHRARLGRPARAARAAGARTSLTVVTQPNFVAERGDQYLTDVDADDQPYLYPCRTLLDEGVPVAGSTDAPFGHPDPWRAIAAATARRTAGGRPLGTDERLDPAGALALFLGPPESPGGAPRRVRVGAAADLCLLRGPLADVDERTSAEIVRMTVIGGRIVHRSVP